MTSFTTGTRSAHPSGGIGSRMIERSPLQRLWGDRRIRIAGLRFVAIRPRRAADELVQASVTGGAGEHVHLANAYTIALADASPALRVEAFEGDGWILPDGRPLSWISHLRRDRPVVHQVRGPQFFLDVCELGVAHGLKHYLLGAAPEVLETLEAQLRHRFPGIDVVGSDSPPFRSPTAAELDARDAAIAASGAHVVWVGLGTPKQDLEAARLAASLPVRAVAVGAAFDFAAGTLREAPRWMRSVGLEWAFRFAMEPRRLWRRYVFSNARFLVAVLRAGRR